MQFKSSALPPELEEALLRVGRKLANCRDLGTDIDGIVSGLNVLSPDAFAQAESEIVYTANLYRSHQPPALLHAVGLASTDFEQLRRVRGLEFLFLFHRDGFVREAALKKLDASIPSAFLFVALAWRLNDWVLEVRNAASECARRTFPLTEAQIVARAATVLLRRRSTWGRWVTEGNVLDEAFARTDVAEVLAGMVASATTGPAATILRHALRSPSMDAHLPHLARHAAQPAVRVVAVRTLIDGFASWPCGERWRWVDKTMGIRRRETVFETRNLAVAIDRADQISAGLLDRSPAVRDTAISGLIRHPDQAAGLEAQVERLLADRSRRVRERAAFVMGQAGSCGMISPTAT